MENQVSSYSRKKKLQLKDWLKILFGKIKQGGS